MAGKRLAASAVLMLAMLAASAAPMGADASRSSAEGDSDAADVIVLLDVSQSALPYFQDVTDYVVSSVVEEYLRYGDTFHLLSFGETTQAEIAQRMSSEADVKAVLGKLYLLYPLARYSDLVGALNYLYQYMADLPLSRRKVVVVITDGVHNPPPSSSTYGESPDQVRAAIEAAAARIRANGWPVNIIRLPFPKPGERGAPASGSAESRGTSYLDAAARALGAEVSDFSRGDKADIALKSLSLPSAEFPGPLGKKDYSFSFPLKLSNGSDSAVGLELDRVRLGDADILTKKAFLTLQSGRSGTMEVPVLIPDSVPDGEAQLQIRLHFANGVRVSPDTAVLQLTLARSFATALLRSGARVALFAVILVLGLAAILGIVIMLRRMPRSAEAPIAAAVLRSEAAATATTSAAAASPAPAQEEAPRKALDAALGALPKSLPEAPSTAPRKAAIPVPPAARAVVAAAQPGPAARETRVSAAVAAASSLPSKPVKDEHEAAIEGETARLAALRQAESERGAAILAAAAGRRTPAGRPSGSAEAKARAAAYAPRAVKPGIIEVELLVSEQNPHIGSRNVHRISAGGSKSVGGGRSDFLIFLVRVPRRSAELCFDGEKLSFLPLRPELFPELKGPVEDCLGRDIPMISRSGYPLTLRFALYERPVDKINKLLHCIDTTGL
jgi:hypothetical protein